MQRKQYSASQCIRTNAFAASLALCVCCLVAAANATDVGFVSGELSKGVKISVWPESDGGAGKAPYAVKNTEGGNLRLTDVAKPELTMFAPRSDRPVPAVIVCPGGGYAHISYTKEGTEVAEWLQGLGMAAFILKYSCPDLRERAFADLQRAVSLVRSKAEELNIDADKVGVMGFSAGANLSARVSTNWRHRSYASVDSADEFSCRPDYAILVCPTWLVPGENEESSLPVALRGEYPVDARTPPAFLVQAQDDHAHVENALAYYIALKYAGVGAELHVYPEGGHGIGMRRRGKATDGWEALAACWLKAAVMSKKESARGLSL